MKYQLQSPFRSISGVIERRYNHDGTCETLIARKDGTIFWRRTTRHNSAFAASHFRRDHRVIIPQYNPDSRL